MRGSITVPSWLGRVSEPPSASTSLCSATGSARSISRPPIRYAPSFDVGTTTPRRGARPSDQGAAGAADVVALAGGAGSSACAACAAAASAIRIVVVLVIASLLEGLLHRVDRVGAVART